MLTAGRSGHDDIGSLLRMLAEQATEHAFILLNPAGEILWWSAGAELLFAQPSAGAVGQPISKIFTADDLSLGIADLELKIASSDAVSEDDRWHVRADGSRFWSAGALIALRNPAGDLVGFGKLLRDRTRLKEQLEQQSNEIEAARKADEEKNTSIATLTHELRNLVAAVSHGARLLRAEPDEARRGRLIELLEHHAEGVQRLTDDLFDASRISLGRMSIKAEDRCLKDLITKVVEAMQPRARDKAVKLDLLMPSGPIGVNGDAVRLHQVFANLVENAIKYTPPQGRIWVKATVEDDEAVVHVQDTGIGIAAHMLTSIFDLFTQAETPAAPRGLGIGLALVKELVALHGGTVQASSPGEGLGSQFTVRLPLHQRAR